MGYILSVEICFLTVVFVSVLTWTCPSVKSRANDSLSYCINGYLLWRYPISHIDGSHKLPTYNYRFPNGQGGVSKFLDGTTNSANWEAQSGSIYRIWSGMRGEVVLTRPEHIQLVFKDSEKHKKAINNNSGYLMSQLLGSCVGLISGMEWKTARFVLERPFLHNASNNYVPMIQKHVLQHLDKLHRGTDLKQGFLHPADDLKLLPFWIVAEIFYGSLSDSMAAELQVLAQDREDLFKQVIRGGVSRFTFSKYLSTETNKLLDNFQRGWKAFNNEAARRAKETNQGEPIVYFYEMVTAGVLTEAQLLQTLDEALFANLDVTTGGISWNLVYLATHESYQAAIQQEVQSAPDKEEYIRSNSTLLAACISESSRLQPLAAFSIPQAAPTARVIDGYIIPAGTDFIVDSYALNIRNEFWGKDADVYRPERFLERKNTETRYHFWRFGFGPRQCMGKYVADLILRVLLVHVVENYNLSIDSVEDIWRRNPESWITHPHMRIRCWKKDNAV